MIHPLEKSGRWTAIFTKRPLPGRVKTRLCPPLEAEQAARLAQAMLDDAVRRCCACREFSTALVHAPAEESGWFAQRYRAVDRLEAQRGEDLGERLASFFKAALDRAGVNSLVVMGSDQPLCSTERLVAAHQALEQGADLVLGSDSGGGYDLIGMVHAEPRLFLDVKMSSDHMAQATLSLAAELGWKTVELAGGFDVDRREDLLRLAHELKGLPADHADFPHATARVLQCLKPQFQ